MKHIKTFELLNEGGKMDAGVAKRRVEAEERREKEDSELLKDIYAKLHPIEARFIRKMVTVYKAVKNEPWNWTGKELKT